MKYKTLFRLMVKAVGILLFGQGVAMAGMGAASFILRAWLDVPIRLPVSFEIGQIVASLVPCALGAYLFFGGRWVVNLAIPSNRPYCPECAYDLTGAVTGRCPECGTPFRLNDVRPSAAVEEAKQV